MLFQEESLRCELAVEPGQLNGGAPGERFGGPSSSTGLGSNFSLEI